MIAGTIRNAVNQMQLVNDWEQKKATGDVVKKQEGMTVTSQEESMIQHFREQLERDKESSAYSQIYNKIATLVLQHQNTKYKSENDRLKMKHQLLCVLQDSIAFKDELNEWIKYILSELRIKDLLIDSDIIPDEWENLKSLLELEMWSSIRSHTKR